MEQTESKKKPKKRETKSKRKHKNKEVITRDELLDKDEELHPIGHYINNRDEMIHQIFSVMEKEKLHSMLPPLLQDMMVDELKKRCLEELTMMPECEIHRILKGERVEPTQYKAKPSLVSDMYSSTECNSSSEGGSSDKSVTHHKTLLDILELEMQAIAYRTILKTESANENTPECRAASVQPEIEIKKEQEDKWTGLIAEAEKSGSTSLFTAEPEQPSVKEESNTEEQKEFLRGGLVSVKSSSKEDLLAEQRVLCEQTEHFVSSECPEVEIIREQTDGNSEENSLMPVHSLPANNCYKNLCKTSESQRISVCAADGVPQIIPQPHESFVVHVSSAHSNISERTVKKVPAGKVSVSKFTASHNVHDKTGLQQKNEALARSVTSSANTNFESKEVMIPDTDVSEGLGGLTTLASHPVIPCLTKISDASDEEQLTPNKGEREMQSLSERCEDEKEEGELTDIESDCDIEVIDVVQDRRRSPTIFVSSSDEEKGTQISPREHTQRKHHRKHSNRSSYCTNRRIKKRGNRSYRHKVTPSPEADSCTPLQVESIPAETETQGQTPCHSDPSSSNTDDSPAENNEEEPSDAESEVEDTEPLSAKSSWADRWAKSKDIKKVVTTSKIYTTVRKRIISARKCKEKREDTLSESTMLPPVPPLVLHVEGSVQEYEMLQWLSSVKHISTGEEASGNLTESVQDTSHKTAPENFKAGHTGEAADEVKINAESLNEVQKEMQFSSSTGETNLSSDGSVIFTNSQLGFVSTMQHMSAKGEGLAEQGSECDNTVKTSNNIPYHVGETFSRFSGVDTVHDCTDIAESAQKRFKIAGLDIMDDNMQCSNVTDAAKL